MPLIIVWILMSDVSDFFLYTLYVTTSILIFWNILESRFVFVKLNENPKKIKNALYNRTMIKYATIIAVSILGLSLVLDHINSNIVPLEKDRQGEWDIILNRIVVIALHAMAFSASSFFMFLVHNGYYKGRAYAYFALGLNAKDNKKREYYQAGVYALEGFTSEKYGVKIKHRDEIESMVLSMNTLTLDTEIRHLLKMFHNDIEPIKKLNLLIEKSEKEIFTSGPAPKHVEKIIGVVVPIITAIIAILQHFKVI